MPYRSFAFRILEGLGHFPKRGFGTLPDKQKRRAAGRRVLTANDTALAQHGTICLCLQVRFLTTNTVKSAKLQNFP